MSKSLFDFSAISINGKEVALSEFRDNVVVVVNTASKCGFTPQYEGLELLYKKYKNDGLVILGFPCNQFGNQESGNDDDIQEFCQVNYGVSFPMFSKVDVNGTNAHPVFNFLRKELSGTLGSSIKWNFTKFLVDRSGKPLKRFSPMTSPETMESDIKKLL